MENNHILNENNEAKTSKIHLFVRLKHKHAVENSSKWENLTNFVEIFGILALLTKFILDFPLR